MRSTLGLLLLGCLLAGVLANGSYDLTDDDFDSRLASFDTSLVMFYAPW